MLTDERLFPCLLPGFCSYSKPLTTYQSTIYDSDIHDDDGNGTNIIGGMRTSVQCDRSHCKVKVYLDAGIGYAYIL